MNCGIYAIVNVVNGKKYIGKSIDIERRWKSHLAQLRAENRNKNCNRYLFNAFKKYGESNFKLEYVELFDVVDEDLLSDRELFWMEELNTLNREFGYNLRKDSSGKCIVSDETRELISKSVIGDKNPNFGNYWTDEQKQHCSVIAKENHAKGLYSSLETRNKLSESSKKFWKENPEKKEMMKKKVSEKRTTYKIAQYTKSGELVKVWNTMFDILQENPDYFRIAIYNCVNGYKKSYRKFIWKKII